MFDFVCASTETEKCPELSAADARKYSARTSPRLCHFNPAVSGSFCERDQDTAIDEPSSVLRAWMSDDVSSARPLGDRHALRHTRPPRPRQSLGRRFVRGDE